MLAPPPPPPSRWVSKSVEEKKNAEAQRHSSEDKWQSLKAFRHSKGLCFVCGEKWTREHQCENAIQLHVVQEMVEYMQLNEDCSPEAPETPEELQRDPNLMLLSAPAVDSGLAAPRTMLLQVTIQGNEFTFLVVSCSSSCFIDRHKAQLLQGVAQLPSAINVKVAGGATLQCNEYFPRLVWETKGIQFTDNFRVLALGSYDGSIGLDWLSKYSPMITHWAQGWIAIQKDGRQVVLHGEGTQFCTHALVELHHIRDSDNNPQPTVLAEIQQLLSKFSSVFATPVGLPPRRQCDHHIPLILGARPISIQPYRVAPDLKDELEKQVKELLEQGVITHSNGSFGSLVILVKKGEPEDKTWRLVVDYRHLNALTVKGKYPLPVIDELLDELAGAKWFSKLDLKAGYHQIRLASSEEHKTAFQTHNGHYEFKVMAFGLTGPPATFQHAMNASLAPVLRKFALVLFDDILIYSKTFSNHLEHFSAVLSILQRDKWQAKLSKCAFAQERIAYPGHVISAKGVATDESKIQSIESWPVPQSVRELRGFLGLSGYYRKFI